MFISLDLETTGFDSKNDKIIEFGAVKFDLSGKQETYQTLINPGGQIPQIVTYITKIKDSDLTDAPTFDEKRDEIAAFIGDLPIIGHNIQFDTGFLRENGIPLENLEYDTHDLAAMLVRNVSSYSLEVLSKVLNIGHEDAHRALDDAIAAMDLFKILTTRFEQLPEVLITQIHSLLEKSEWPLKNHLLNLKHKESNQSPTQEKPAPTTPATSHHEQIINQEPRSALQLAPPYQSTLSELIKQVPDSAYLSIPDKLFCEIESSLPDSVAKIDCYRQYISEEKFTQHLKQDHFENDDIAACIKILIWLNQTQTGILREVRIKGEELRILSHVAVDPNTQDPLQEKWVKKALESDKNLPAICSHQFLLENCPENSELIIFDYENFEQSLYRKQAHYIHYENCSRPLNILQEIFPENQSIKSLQAKLNIIFSLIGMIFEKYNDGNKYGARSYVNESIINSKEWQDLSNGISALIEVSKELGEIKNDLSFRHLHNWKERLLELDSVVRNTDINKNLIFVEIDWLDNLTLRQVPYSIEEALNKILDSNSSYKIIDETLVSVPNFIKKSIGENKNRNIEVNIHKNINDRDKFSTIHFLTEQHEKEPKKRAIVVNSRKVLEFLTLELAKTDIKIVSQLTASTGKLEANFKIHDNAVLICTPNMWERISCHAEIEELIIPQIPFEPPSDAILMAKSATYSNAFEDLQIPRSFASLTRIINRISGASNTRTVHILDSRLSTKSYGKNILEKLSAEYSVA